MMPEQIVIVGGGSAGWMTALHYAHHLPHCDITLIESSDVGIIGVGEGSTPYLKAFFKHLGIDESEWMHATDATYKTGIQFDNWSTVPSYTGYFHPFFSAFDKTPAETFFKHSGLQRRGYEADALPDHYFVAATLAEQKRSPVPDNSVPFDVDYAYHFDAGKLGQFLKQKALEKGVTHIVEHIQQVRTEGENVVALETSQRRLAGDFFVDCSGFAKVLQQHAPRKWVDYSDTLFNDMAVAIPTPLNHAVNSPKTISKALRHGWMWRIPLTSRWGNGYVFSSDYCSVDEAKRELQQELALSDDAIAKARVLRMSVGRLEQHWYHNTLSIGLSQGFIEPLEATALMLVQFSIEKSASLLASGDCSAQNIAQFNQEINTTFDGVKDYISMHYILNTRNDTPYWRDAREKTYPSATVNALLEAWDSGADFEQALSQHKSSLVYLRPSWYCILSGMGRHPVQLQPYDSGDAIRKAQEYCRTIAQQHFDALS
ncbi:MAG: tryptophan halogenase family protein [Aestuariibacter sp.]